MSQENNQDYASSEVPIERQEAKHESIETEGGEDNQLDEEANVMTAEVKDGMYLQRLLVKKEVVTDDDSENEEYYVFADDMEMVKIAGDVTLGAALTAEDPNNENTQHFIIVGTSNNSNAFAAGDNNDQLVNSEDESPLYIDLSPSKKNYKNKIHKKRLDFGERFNLKNLCAEGSVGNKIDDYDSEIVIYPVQNNVQNIERKRMYRKNSRSVTRKFDKNKGNSHTFKISNCTGLLEVRDNGKIRLKSIHKDETHPFKCKECGESFELKSHFEMHELGHEKYKFYSFRTNTVRCICVQCKKPYLYSADDKEPTSNMCIPCVLKLRERMTVCNPDKAKETGTRQLFHFPDIRNPPKTPKLRQCYTCGRRSDRYFAYGASLLCSKCWEDRTRRVNRGCKSPRSSFQHGSFQRHNSAFPRYAERDLFKRDVPHLEYNIPEEKPNLIGTHFLLSSFDASHSNRVEEKNDFQELQEDWSETEIYENEDQSGSSSMILCDKTGEFIDINF